MRVTREEYLDLDDDGFRYDMRNGVLTMAPSPNFEHNEISGDFLFHLKKFLESSHLGHVVPETDVMLPDAGDVLRPDISFILNENMGMVKTHIHGAPDLICEILSDSTREYDLGEKAQRYLTCGVKEYWIIDPKGKSFELWLNRKDRWEKLSGQRIKSKLLHGFELINSDLFG